VAAAFEGEVGDALAVGELDDEVALAGGGGSDSLLPHAETATSTSAPVAQEINPSRIFMVCVLLPLAVRREAQTRPCGGACIV
jgi:hypothetical protein